MNWVLILLTVPFIFCDLPRLDKHVLPYQYELTVKTNIPGYGIEQDLEGTFEGNVIIQAMLLQPQDSITLHADSNIRFILSECSVYRFDNSTSLLENITQSDQYEQVQLQLTESQIYGAIVINLTYTSNFKNNLAGLYLSTYLDEQGNTKHAAVTQLEPYSARSLVPCFDEPTFKSKWYVVIIHPNGTTALSNQPSYESVNYNDRFLITKFENSPTMSSYLLAIVVSEYQYKSGFADSGLEIRVFAPAEHFPTVDYALEGAIKAFNYFENLTGYNVPLPKMDLIGFKDFASGAMENWGLITFAEGALYGNESYIYAVIAHEIAHQWFGNLVTIQWWNELWLNEGSASFYECLGVQYMTNGEVKSGDCLRQGSEHYLQAHIYLSSEQPTTVKIDSLESIGRAFGVTTYQKGGAIMNMLKNVIGHRKFDQSIRNYIKDNAYSNTNSSIYYSYFTTGLIGKGPSSISEFLEPWYNQIGHPLITVDYHNDTHNILSQSKFKKYGNEQDELSVWGYQWDIPVWYLNDEKRLKLVWLLKNSTAYIPKNATINPGGTGIFRVRYNTRSKALYKEEGYIHSRLSDSFAFALLGHITIEEYNETVSELGYLDEEQKKVHKLHTKFLRGHGLYHDFEKLMDVPMVRGKSYLPKAWEDFKKNIYSKKKFIY